MRKVLLNLVGGDPASPSGIAIYALKVFGALAARRRHRYALLSTWSAEQLAPYMDLSGVELLPGRATQSEKLQFWLQSYEVARAARRVDADVVFTPWPLAPLWGGRRRILVLHDLYRQTHPELFALHYRLAWNAYFPLSVAASDTVVAVSETTAAEFRRLFPAAAGKAVTVLEASTIAARPRPERPLAGPYGLVVSTAVPTKNLPRLIAALDLLRKQGRETRLAWIGRDHEGAVAAALAAHPDLGSFLTVGRVDEATLATWYAHADFYVAPSLTEGFCLPIVEAQKEGVPVACSDIPIFREVAPKGSLTFDPFDPAAIAAAIGRLSDDPALRTRLSTEARDNAARFSWDKAAAELEALFEG